MRELPAGTVTFLFTDIEGSTRLLHELGDAYAGVLADHRRLLREAFVRHKGIEVDTQGDSFFVAFADPRGAVAAAVDAQMALARHAWPDSASVRVRMGVHTGEPLVADDHYVGVDVHRGARIAAAAHGGQALVSERTRDLVGDATPSPLRDLGAHRLKDLPEAERLYQLVIDGLPSSFPPPRGYEEALEAAGLPDYSLPPADVPCPYKGLVPFEADDTDIFFGREQLVEDLAGRLETAPFLAVVGASGSGKSSLVRAGVVPELQRRDGSLSVAVFLPGERPLVELTAAGEARLVVVDQFEEVFTLCRDEDERSAFIDALLDAAERGTRVIVALRADFYGHCAAYPRFAAVLKHEQELVGPMSEEELRRTIERPAEHAGLLLEPGLVEAILRDVAGEPGALPLLSHSLLETWKRRSGRMLTLIGYLQAGGVQGAIAKTAETVYREALSPEHQALARNIFLRLTELGEGTEDTRRRVAIAELTPRPDQLRDVDDVLRTLADARLVVIGEGTVEVAHEALIRHWPTLRSWLDEDREGRLVHRRLTEAAQEWDATGREPALLYRGTRLASATDWAGAHDSELNELEREFLTASRDAELREIESTRRRNRRLRILLAGALVALAGAVAAGLLALDQRNAARDTALTADAQRLGAEALTEDRLDRALLLARAGVELEETARTRSNLLGTLLRSPHAAIGLLRGTADAEIYTAAVTPDGRVLAIGQAEGTVTTFDTASRRKLREYRVGGAIGDGLVQTLAFSPDGATLAVAGRPRFTETTLVLDLLDARTLQRRSRVELPPLPELADFGIATPRFASGGRDVLVLHGPFPGESARSVLLRVDTETGDIEGRPLRVGGGALEVLPTRDGRRVFVPSPVDESTLEIDAASLRVLRRHPAGGVAGALSPDGRALALGSGDGSVRLIDVRSGDVRAFARGHGAGVLDMAFTPDGRTLVSSDFEGEVIVWGVARGVMREELASHRGPVWALAVSPNGRTVYTAGNDGRLLLWDLAGDRRLVRSFPLLREFEEVQTPRGLAVSPDGETLALTTRAGTVELLDAATFQRRRSVQAARGFAAGLALSPDGRLLAVGGERGDVTLWDARTLAPAGELTGLHGTVQAVAFSPDGKSLAAAEVVAERPRLLVWNVRRRGVTAQADIRATTSLGFSPDGRVIALAALDGGTEIRNVRSGKLVKRLPAEGLSRSVAFSPDGSLLAVGQFDGDGQLYSTETWAPLGRRLEAHTQRITNVEFSRDGRTLATSSADGTALIWDVETQEPIGSPLSVEPDTFVSVALSPDGSYMFAVSTGLHGVRLATDPEVWKRHACLVAGRDLIPREWKDALPDRRYRAVCAGA
jgi:WD40 repeat protein/class 3 adenylate cyclase/energy-coupling factor transporter ATP-binding protein EcfA2